jgi:hypothetical protein
MAESTVSWSFVAHCRVSHKYGKGYSTAEVTGIVRGTTQLEAGQAVDKLMHASGRIVLRRAVTRNDAPTNNVLTNNTSAWLPAAPAEQRASLATVTGLTVEPEPAQFTMATIT